MKKLVLVIFLLPLLSLSQVGINTTTPNAMLDIASDDSGILIPRVALTSATDATTVTNPQGGVLEVSTLIYNTATAGAPPNAVVPGFYYWNGTLWAAIGSGGAAAASEFESIGGVVQNTTATATDHFVFGSTALDDIAGTDDDNRMFFNKAKGAFRAGFVDGTQWDDANVGTNSTAFGAYTTASGDYATAFGASSYALGDYATAWGGGYASGYYATAFGEATTASGASSTAWGGNLAEASGDLSTAFGEATIASGNNATAWGFETEASDYNATAFGEETVASGYNATAFGITNTASGYASTAFGGATIASGSQATAFGGYTTASGDNATAFGGGNTAASAYETVIGSSATEAGGDPTNWVTTDRLFAIGNGSGVADRRNAVTLFKNGNFVVGSHQLDDDTGVTHDDNRMFFNKAKAAFRAGNATTTQWNDANVGDYSVALGRSSRASGEGAAAFGYGNVAEGIYSTALGRGNLAASAWETVLGGFALNAGGSPTTLEPTDRLFAVGNGTGSAARSDAFSILKSGLTRLPATDNAMIDAADGKAVVTKEWVQANTGSGSGEFESIGGVVQNTTATATDHFVFGSTALDDIAGTDDNARMFFNKAKGAFRAGSIGGTGWDDANVGVNSTAFGGGSIASGNNATAFGNVTASGDYATAFGASNTASGDYAMVFGSDNTALGGNATVFGAENSASGDYSTAWGNVANASGEFSTAFGSDTNATGGFSTAFGQFSIASGNHSTVWGVGNTASSRSETVLGEYSENVTGSPTTWVATDRLFAVGNGTNNANRSDAFSILKSGLTRLPATNNAMIDAADGKAVVTKEWVQANMGSGEFESIGGVVQNTTATATDHFVFGSTALDNIAGTDDNNRMFFNKAKGAFRAGRASGTQWDDADVGVYSVAFGYDNTASGSYSTAFGWNTTASEEQATAFGYETTASSYQALAFGFQTEASGSNSVAFGDRTTAALQNTTAFGQETSALELNATAFGYLTTASGILSTAFGNNSTAAGEGSTAFGAHTTASGDYSTTWGHNNTAGSYVETVLGVYATNAGGDPDNWVATDRLFAIGNGINDANRHDALTILKNGRMGLQTVTNPTYALQLPNSATNGIGRGQANAWDTYSDGRVKSHRTTLSYGLTEVMRLEPLQYFHHDSNVANGSIEIQESGEEQIGFIAQDMYKIIPEIVGVPEDETQELWGISYDKLTPVLVKAIQEQQAQIEAQRAQIEVLQAEKRQVLELVNGLEARLNALEGQTDVRTFSATNGG